MKHNLNTKIIIFASIFLLILVANPTLIAIGQEDTYTNDTSSSDQTPEEQTSENQTSGEPMSQNNTMTEESMTQEQTMMEIKSPKKQMDDGVAPNDVVCKEGLELLIKTSDGSAACVKSSSIQVLIARGWGSTPA